MKTIFLLIFTTPFFAVAQFTSQSLLSTQQVRFIENKGQLRDMENRAVTAVYYKASVPGVDVYITEKGLTYTFFRKKGSDFNNGPDIESGLNKSSVEWERIDMQLNGAVIKKENIYAEQKDPAAHHFFSARASGNIRNVNGYGKITVKNIYPGIDWVLYNASGKGFKYDFVVHPGAKVSDIIMSYHSLSPALLDDRKYIHVGVLTEAAPFTYVQKSRKSISSSFSVILTEKHDTYYSTDFGFSIKKPPVGQTFVIDPNLTWGTYFGGSLWDGPTSMESDSKGNVYVCGATTSPNFPILANGGYYQGTGLAIDYGFILKFSKSGQLLWSAAYADTTSYSSTVMLDLCIDQNDNVFLSGNTNGLNLPVQTNATFFQPLLKGIQDGFIMKFDSVCNLMWATYIGGNGAEFPYSICANAANEIYLTGTTTSTNFPLQNSGGYYNSTPDTNGCGFIARFSNSGTLLWSTLYPGLNPKSCAVDSAQNLIVVGQASVALATQSLTGAFFQPTCAGFDDAGIVKFNSTDNRTWATFFGGTSGERAFCVAADQSGNFFVLGHTTSTNIPLQNSGGYYKPLITGSGDIFLAKFTGSSVLGWSTYYGGSGNEGVGAFDNMEFDKCGNLYVGIDTYSSDMPAMASCEGGYWDQTLGGVSDHFISRFSPTQVQQWGTYVGGTGFDYRTMLEVDKDGNLYLAGYWPANNLTGLPLVNPGLPAYYDATPNAYNDAGLVKFVNPALVPAFNYPPTNCMASGTVGVMVAQLAASGSFSASPGLMLDPLTGAIDPNSSVPGTYTVTYIANTVTGVCSCSISPTSKATATYQVLNQASVTVNGTNTLCAGQSATLTAIGAATYSWSNAMQTQIIIVSPGTTTQYSVIGTSVDGCTDTANFTITVGICTNTNTGSNTAFGENVNPKQVLIYPNPSRGTVIITTDFNVNMILFDASGTEIKQIRFSDLKRTAQLDNLPTGVYLLKDIDTNRTYKLLIER